MFPWIPGTFLTEMIPWGPINHWGPYTSFIWPKTNLLIKGKEAYRLDGLFHPNLYAGHNGIALETRCSPFGRDDALFCFVIVILLGLFCFLLIGPGLCHHRCSSNVLSRSRKEKLCRNQALERRNLIRCFN